MTFEILKNILTFVLLDTKCMLLTMRWILMVLEKIFINKIILEIMKKLEDFMSTKIQIKSIYGGDTVSTNSSKRDKNNCLVETWDSFEDSNCNGVRDKGESYETCTVITC